MIMTIIVRITVNFGSGPEIGTFAASKTDAKSPKLQGGAHEF